MMAVVFVKERDNTGAIVIFILILIAIVLHVLFVFTVIVYAGRVAAVQVEAANNM